jgi:HK97 family phage major capsid protein
MINKNKRIIGYLGLAALALLAVWFGVPIHFLGWHPHLAMAGLALAAAPVAFTEEQLGELKGVLSDVAGAWSELKKLPAAFTAAQQETDQIKLSLESLRRRSLDSAATSAPIVRGSGRVSGGCARALAAHFIAHCERSGKLEALASLPAQRDALTTFARDSLGLTTRTALSTSDIPLPIQYGSELRELISSFGVARNQMTPYPIGMGTARPARMGTRPAFGSIAMSAALPEKSPTLSFASLESHKIGGVVRLPREIDEQSIVAMGQFLARYGAIEFARAEDLWGFLRTAPAPTKA